MISRLFPFLRKKQTPAKTANPQVKANFVIEPKGTQASIKRHVEDAAAILKKEGFREINTTTFGTEVAGNLDQVRDAMRQLATDLSKKDIPKASMRVELNFKNAA